MPDSRTLDLANRLVDLHADAGPLVLPTVWDVWSAKTAVAAGFTALTIGSHPLADSHGRGDNEGQTLEEVLADAAVITAAVDVPVSVDLESGYGADPADLVKGLIEAGGVGLNLEDTVHSEGGRLRSTEEHAAYIKGLRDAADLSGIPVVVNGRTDLFAHADDPASVLDEAIERLQALVAAGADTVYPVKIQDDDDLIAKIVAAIDRPVNITAHPVKHDLARLDRLGVGRVTFGPLFMLALTDAANAMLANWQKPDPTSDPASA